MQSNTVQTPNIFNDPDDRMSWSKLLSLQWTGDFKISPDPNETRTREYIVSTDPNLIPMKTLMEAFDQEFFYWGKALPEEDMRLMVHSSLCFGLYIRNVDIRDRRSSGESMAHGTKDPEVSLIGFARLVTDCVTVGYLTDFYVLPRYQGTGLGTWLLKCIQEIADQWPYLRRIMFFTNSERSKLYYERVLGALALAKDGETYFMERPGPARPTPLPSQQVAPGLEQAQ